MNIAAKPAAAGLEIARLSATLTFMIASLLNRTSVMLAEIAGLALLAWVAWSFNQLVRTRNLMREGWSGIDVQLKRRRNLVPEPLRGVPSQAQPARAGRS